MIDGMIYVADFLLKSKDGEKREGIKANLYKNLILILQQMYTLYLLVVPNMYLQWKNILY